MPPSRAVDWAMVLLAVFSVSLLVVEFFTPVTPAQAEFIGNIDLAIVAVFWVEFAVRLGKAERKGRYVLAHWYDVLGMLPVSHPALRSLRLLRLLRLLFVFARLVRAFNRAFGEEFYRVTFGKYKAALVEEISDRLTLRILTLAQRWFTKVKLSEALRKALEENRQDLVWMEHEILQTSPKFRRFSGIPGYVRASAFASEAVTDVLIRTLSDERMNAILARVMSDLFEEMKKEVSEKEWKKVGASSADAPAGGGG
ncbi:MAG: hypothetical protein QXO51_08035 [Halobacteria archaeon]